MTAEYDCDILIVGGGCGGCAAAMSATSLGMKVIMTEESDWIGGQLTTQITPPDEHDQIESYGCTRRYRNFRNAVRRFYKDHYPLTAKAQSDEFFNPGLAKVSALSCEPKVALWTLESMLAYTVSAGNLKIKRNHKAVSVETAGDQIRAVTLTSLQNQEEVVITARYVLDATELGDLLKFGGVEYITGAESQNDTGEPHAVSGKAQPENMQAITWCLATGYDSQGHHVIDKPTQYDFWVNYTPNLDPAWSGTLLSWTYSNPITLTPTTAPLFSDDSNFSLWNYRRILAQKNFFDVTQTRLHDITIVNWPQNDYFEGSIIDQPESEIQQHMEASRQLSLSLLYWMQTEAPRQDGGVGYPGLYLRPDVTGTEDGLAKCPYIRESRRILAKFTVTELHVGQKDEQTTRASEFHDSIGIGSYRIDLHPSTGGNNYIDIPSLRFQIPLGALIPIRMKNLIPACKNIGTTHITNGCYRLHPVEWNIGESAGLLAAYCLQRNLQPEQIHEDDILLSEFQTLLQEQGIELAWPE